MFSLFKKKSNVNANMGPKRKSLANISRNLQSGTGVARNDGLGRRVHSLPSFIRYLNNHSHIIGSNRPPNLHPIVNNSNRILYNTVQNNIKLSNGESLKGKTSGQLSALKRNRIAKERQAYGNNHNMFFAMKSNIEKIQSAMYNVK